MGSDRNEVDDDESDAQPAIVTDGGPEDGSRRTWDQSDPDSLTSTVVRAVAETAEIDPLEMSEPLNDVLDADALGSLLASGPGDGSVSVTFELAGQVVTARDDGVITVQSAPSASGA
ncbi:HalOD1 output domain-containing protein [Halorientalis brevis]|uniref:HalOD1 output domain-containing protein n=1 Tax=Halorientalis brevis TaxID=1126241 RepID=A0ABD6C7K1_9EURY|nr:HalOD1 output domain-containing protein [Halorientalis brevis]